MGPNKLTTVAWVYVRNALINYVSRRRPPALVAVENERDGDAWEELGPVSVASRSSTRSGVSLTIIS